MASAAFAGFGPQALPFFTALAFHQSREWMEANKGLYETDVRAPMGLLLEEASAQLAWRDIPLRGSLKTSMFRLNRDVRFARDKALYKIAAGAVLTRSGNKNDPGLVYLHLDPKGCFFACGVYHPLPAQKVELRADIRDRAAAFRSACAAMAPLELSQEDSLTRAPRGFETVSDPDIASAVRMRSLVFRQPVPDELMVSPALVAGFAGFAEKAVPFLRFCWNALDRVPLDGRAEIRKPKAKA